MGNPKEQKISRRNAVPLLAAFPFALAAVVEGCAGPEWKAFSSSNFPYKIEYPNGFSTAVTTTQSGYKTEVFGEVVNGSEVVISVSGAPLGRSLDQQEQAFVETFQRTDGGRDQINILASPGNKNPSQSLKVGGSDAYLIGIHILQGVSPRMPGPHDLTVALFVAGGLNWSAALSTNAPETQKYLPVFRHMLDTFQLKR